MDQMKTARSYLKEFEHGQCGKCGNTAEDGHKLVDSTQAEHDGHRGAIWLSYCEECVARMGIAAALGSIRTPKKAKSSAANGKKGGRPKKEAAK